MKNIPPKIEGRTVDRRKTKKFKIERENKRENGRHKREEVTGK